MSNFIKEVIDGEKVELLIDATIFPINIVLKASYNFLERGYFFFKYDEDGNIILELTRKEEIKEDLEKILGDYSDELLSVLLRDNLERDNKEIREKIVGAAISNSLDQNNFVKLDTGNPESNQIDFDKDIDDILAEIENDPELKIDEDEISKILAEIEEESEGMVEEPKLNLDVNAINDVKKKFGNN